ncbi:AAA family ATPase [Steroidobacter sp. S1-65]|uniref:AAA family ATPase n=1 Tax=Steroidobacter gossypii TaxID=2805490 RepID=A0ABS1X322_9GAMM|nr:AAA family ATPase [Steroidobacter gossypii]MBM0107617.1 AAA family ATPase [Steroidobacter gossypii]
MQKIVVLNPKGGSGKTTIATNLASYFAVEGLRPTLMDMDAQGSSTHWLSKRTKEQPLIHGIAGFERNTGVTRSFATRLSLDTQRLVVDTPAAVEPEKLPDLTRNATAVLVPVLPSDIDIHAAAKCISNLLLIAKIRREEQRIAVIANRVKKQTLIYKSLMKFLENLQIPVIATLRDSQVYIRAAEIGHGVFEMKPNSVREDLEQWLPLVGWLAQRKTLHIEPGTPAITSALTSAPKVATTTLDSIIPPAPAAAKPSVFAPPKPADIPRLNPEAVMNAVASPASALSSRAGGSSKKLERSGSLLPALLRRVFG